MIGLTGGIASGKSTVTSRLRARGAFVVDADEISREVLTLPGVPEAIREAFGDGVFDEDGSINRIELAARVFSSEARTRVLNSITHPAIASRILELASEAEQDGSYPLVFVDAALLIESGFYTHCSGVWLVTADTNTRIRRIMLRDGLTYDEARLRIERQMSDSEKLRCASVVIDNDGSPEELYAKVDEAFNAELISSSQPELCEIRDLYEEEQ